MWEYVPVGIETFHNHHDTQTEIKFESDGISNETFVMVTIRPYRGLQYWSRPDSELIRKWIDQMLPSDWKRNGRMESLSHAPIGGWKFRYPVKRES